MYQPSKEQEELFKGPLEAMKETRMFSNNKENVGLIQQVVKECL